MLYKCTFFIVFVFCLISCNNSNKNSKAIIDSDKIPKTTNILETTVTQETANDLIIVREPYKAVINSDCEYYKNAAPAGRLKQGQSILILGRYYYSSGFDVVVDVEIEDVIEESFVKEKYITYDDELYTAWFKNVLLTREYYYTESAEFINANSGYKLDGTDTGVYNKKEILQLWRYFYSEERLRISEKYLVIGNSEWDCVYRLESVKKDDNKYTLLLSNIDEEEYEVTLTDNGNSIVMTQLVVKNKEQHMTLYSLLLGSLNYNYVPYDEEKSKKTKNRVLAWVNEQLEKSEK